MQRTGAQILIDQLKIHAVDTVFCVPGESYLHALDAFYDAADAIRLITCRQEGGAAYAAEAYGKLTGKPAICFVTRGPGATNAAIGLHTAQQDSTPLILFVGQVERGFRGRDAFQEVDYGQMFGGIAKWVCEITDPCRIPELVGRAFATAASGRPGPVVVTLPTDMLAEVCAVADGRPIEIPRPAPHPGALAQMREMVAAAERPLLLVGYCGWTDAGIADLRTFAARNGLPTVSSFRTQDLIDNESDVYVGMAWGRRGVAEHIKAADLILALGTRLDGPTTAGYTLIESPRPRQTLIHVYPEAAELGRVYQPDLAIAADVNRFVAAANELAAVDGGRWRAWRESARRDYLAFREPVAEKGALSLSACLAWLRKNLPPDTIYTNGAGNYTAACHRHLAFTQPRTQLAPLSGAMGYGVPAAVAAALRHPERTIVSINGDGCFLMNGQELATAAQYGLKIIFIVVNNEMLGTIRMHQEAVFPGRPIGTELVNPDFAAYARAFGLHGEVVERTEAFAAAFERAIQAERGTLLELQIA